MCRGVVIDYALLHHGLSSPPLLCEQGLARLAVDEHDGAVVYLYSEFFRLIDIFLFLPDTSPSAVALELAVCRPLYPYYLWGDVFDLDILSPHTEA